MNEELKHAYIETELENWKDIFQINHKFFSRFVFRGQGDTNWNIETSLERHIKKNYPNNIDTILFPLVERDMVKEFKWKYPLYSARIPKDNDIIEWLSLMQHYGAPTRLLDFTYSLFIATSFAIASNFQCNSAVWAINKNPLNSKSFDYYRKLNNVMGVAQDVLDSYIVEQANSDLVNNSFNRNHEPLLHLVKPKISNERLSRQQGLFLMPSNIQMSFSSHLRNYISSDIPVRLDFNDLISYSENSRCKSDDISILKIIIPNRLNFEIGKSLREMNLTAELLFPGLDGLARSLTYLRFEGLGDRS